MRELKYENGNFIDTSTGEVIEGNFFELNKEIKYTNTTILHFGKYKDLTVEEVLKINPKYLAYLKNEGFDIKIEGGYKKTNNNDNIRIYSGVSFTSKGEMIDNYDIGFQDIKNYLNNKYFDIAFDEEDISIGDF